MNILTDGESIESRVARVVYDATYNTCHRKLFVEECKCKTEGECFRCYVHQIMYIVGGGR